MSNEINYKGFVEALGLPTETIEALGKENADFKAIATGYTEKIGASSVERQRKTLEEAAKAEAEKNANFSVWNNAEKKFAAAFGIDADKYKDMTKGRYDKMVEDQKAAIEELKTNYEAAKKNDVSGAKFAQLNDQLKAANEQLALLKKYKEEEAPKALEAAKKEAVSKYLGQAKLAGAIADIKEKMTNVTPEVIQVLFESMATFDVNFDAEGVPSVQILNKKGELFARSATENYTDVGLFITEKILGPNKWLKQQMDAPKPPTAPASNGNNNNGSGNGNGVHPRFANAYANK